MPSESFVSDAEDDVPPTSLVTEGTVVDLQTHTRRPPPAESFAALATACARLGVAAADVYGDFDADAGRSYLRRFEAEVAHHFGKEDGVFFLSGGMAQSAALLIHAGRRGGDVAPAFACHPTSHLLLHENDGFRALLGLEAVVVGPGAEGGGEGAYDPEALKASGCYGMEPMRLSHLRTLFDSPVEGSGAAIPRTHPSLKQVDGTDIATLVLELPHREVGGKLTPWAEVEEMSRLCDRHDVQFHCDGARIFEASAGYGHESVKQTARPFKSVYVSFYKGLGAISGAMLLGDTAFCAEARVWLRRLGGNLYSVFPYAISSWDGFRTHCLAAESRVDGGRADGRPCRRVYDPAVFERRRRKLARVLALLQAEARVASIVRFDPAVPETNMVHGYLHMPYDACVAALDQVARSTATTAVTGGIRVLSRMRPCTFDEHDDNDGVGDALDEQFGCRFEWTMGESNSSIEDDLFLLGWKEFARAVTDYEQNHLAP